MRIAQTRQQKVKSWVHMAQALVITIGGILALAVLTESGGFSEEVALFFALCFLSGPAIIYQIMVPMWTRAWRFANVYAFAIIDITYSILWFAAFIAVAVWESKGGSCSNFSYGSTRKCETARATAAFGFFISLLFGATSVLSIRAIIQKRRGANVPGQLAKQNEHVGEMDPTGDAWNSNVNDFQSDRFYRQDDGLDEGLDRRAQNPYDRLQAEDDHPSFLSPTREPRRSYSDQRTHSPNGLGVEGAFGSSGQAWALETPDRSESRSHGPVEHGVFRYPTAPSPVAYAAPSAVSPMNFAQLLEHRVSFPDGEYDRLQGLR